MSKEKQAVNSINNNNIGFKDDETNELKVNKKNKKNNSSNGIPKYVANRMAMRIALATGIPTLAGMGIFIGSYILISRGIADISPSLTLTTSAICFLLGLLGLSYGILSASWDLKEGSLIGLENIGPNIKRMREAFKSPN
tara:strand:+ start:446 stop:865 length:420 start_codon:yes stop_codon:yes gene_type:complete